MVINGKNSKLKKDRPTHIWVQVNNTPIALDALHQSDDTMFGKKTQKENAQDHAIVVNGIEKEYAIGKAAMMDSWGSGEGWIITTIGEGWQVEKKLSPDEREMIWSLSKTFGT